MDILQKTVKCPVCAKGCILSEGKTGACGKYTLSGGVPVEMSPNRFLTICGISVETIRKRNSCR